MSEGGRGLGDYVVTAVYGVVAAAIGVYAGVRVHGSQIDEMKERLNRIEDKLDRLIERK